MPIGDRVVAMELSSRMELISFDVRGEAFCIDIMAVREIRGWTQATPLPQAPDDVRGVINLRGSVLPILDLGARLGLGQTEPTSRNAILVVAVHGTFIGLLVDGVDEILSVGASDIHPAPELCRGEGRSLVSGLLPGEGRMIKVLSLEVVVPETRARAA